ncbi:hypothetical protein [Hyunsoonleella ulvae]|uniref:hypothetical protein n=1 Tax=Hyunsoonleella ulvae TaxID=2799948 RepID=UPI0019399869|nr:hypothetical protein [Hyunsoonleella ulvae]
MPFFESFQTTLKSNKSILPDKSRYFRKTLGGFEWSGEGQFDFPEATPQQLKEIRNRMEKQNRIRSIKLFSIFFVIVVIALIALLYYINN